MKLYKIQDNESFGVAVNKSKALLNYDIASLRKYKRDKQLVKENKVLKEEINILKSDIQELKELIQKSLGK